MQRQDKGNVKTLKIRENASACWKVNAKDHKRPQKTTKDRLTQKMTSAQVVETSVTNNISFQSYLHPDDNTIRTTAKDHK